MGKRDDLIAKYADDLKNKCGMDPDMDLLTKVTIGCGPAIYNDDASTVAATQEGELETVRANFLIKKLGLSDGPELMEAINAVIEDRVLIPEGTPPGDYVLVSLSFIRRSMYMVTCRTTRFDLIWFSLARCVRAFAGTARCVSE